MGNNIEHDYLKLLHDILNNGIKKQDRTGTGTISVFGRHIRHDMSLGFPLLTTKKMPFKTIVTELLWFLRGDTNIKFLVDNGCHIWDGDAYKAFLTYVAEEWEYGAINELFEDGLIIEESNDGKNISYRKLTQEEFINKIKTGDGFAKHWGDLGPIYGKQWRSWKTYRKLSKDDYTTDYRENEPIDQIKNLINDLKTNPDSRRLMVNAWNVGELNQMVLPPCHYGFQVYTRELTWEEQVQWVLKNTDVELENVYIVEEIAKPSTPTRAISLMWNQRSVDTPLGLPFNIASYALLLMMIADEVNMVPEELVGNLGDCHIYLDQQDGVREQLNRSPMKLPKVTIQDGIYCNSPSDILLENYESHPTIKFPLSN
jgi:thymidylate synthase